MRNGKTSPVDFSGIPMGGIGAGSVELRADGCFHDWQLMNNFPWGNGPATTTMEDDGLVFGLVAHDGTKPRTLALSRPRWSDGSSFGAGDFKWMVDPYHMPWNEFPDIDYDGRFPFVNLDYLAPRFPIKARLEAFSPFIPLDAKNSGLPVIYLTYTLTNESRKTQRVSLFSILKNCAGYEEPKNESVIEFHANGRAPYLAFSKKGMPRGAQSDGQMALGLWSKKPGKVTYVLHAAHPRDIHDPLRDTGFLENLDRSTFHGSVGNDLGTRPRLAKLAFDLSRGAIAKTFVLKPGETAQVTFALAWYFPNMAQDACGGKKEIIGHQYENFFRSAGDAFKYAARSFADLSKRSREFVDAFYSSSQDRWLLDAVAAQLTTLPKSAWWDKAGRFAIWEGLGCCGLQTLDITLYGSFPIVLFFPELEKKQMDMVTVTAKTAGRPPHAFHGSFSDCCLYPNNRIDNDVQFTLLVWRDALWTGDVAFAKKMWPAIETYLADIEKSDSDGDGLPNNAGVDQSYDQFPLYGTSAYVGMQYVGALKAASQLAAMLGLSGRSDELAVKAARAFVTLEKQLWNGEYYDLSFDPATGTGNAGCMADQLCGDWFVRQSDGEGLVDMARARRALKAVFKSCRREEGFLANCDWPRGGRVKIRRETSDQANCPWTGVEYAVAAEMILAGLVREGLAIAKDVWDRHEKLGMRYNHIECGDHYYRAMSSWAIYLALEGFAWDAIGGAMTLRVPKAESRFVWNTPSAWGTVTLGAKGALLDLSVVRGTLRLGALTLLGASAKKVKVSASGKPAKAEAIPLDDGTAVVLSRMVTLKAGGRLKVSR